MKIASFNINGIKARLPRLLEWLEETQPDVACLQEIKTQDEGFPAEDFAKIGYQAIWHGQKSFNGVAILARGVAPVEIMRGLPGDPADEQSRYLEAEVAGVRIACIYLPNGNPIAIPSEVSTPSGSGIAATMAPGPKFDYKLAWMERLRARMAAIKAEEVPAVVLGDYNVVPRDSDIWNPKALADDALMQPASRDGYARLLHAGWTDAIATQHPAGGIWTYWDYQAGAWQRNHGFRIDHALLSPECADRLIACGVDKDHRGREKASDHAPMWVELRD